uniref:Polygalacturonase-like n=1 Tax=Nelumbo nucifera TaxID=4432 RepID=A0A822XWB4_NELNU|nr:TPA_asm: hypothetical protein HUJ06_025496 [Nelumbo nucifera]
MLKPITFPLSLLFVFFFYPAAAASYNVASYGAKANGKTDSSGAFLKAWAMACGSVGPAEIYVPPGRYLLNQAVRFGGKCNNSRTMIRIDGTLLAPSDYRVLGSSERWITFQGVNGVFIYGGTLDGQGSSLWSCKAAGKSCPVGARSLSFVNSRNIVISGLSSINSQLFHITIGGCHNVHVRGVTITAPGDSPNTDGIHVESSRDDCISIGPATRNVWIENIACGPGHGISIGSLGWSLNEAGVQNVTVKTVTFTGTQNGLRIKTWGRPSKGFVKGVLYQNAIMKNVENPIIIDQNYCPHNKDCPGQVRSHNKVKISNVRYKHIQGTSATQVTVKFDCSSKNPCTGIALEDAQSSCANVGGTASGLVQPSSCL